ncbi:hypothetical protein HC762_00945 [bacterium]|nr:hypothetical protein [bacterium]
MNLKKAGLRARGIVPNVYGFIEGLDPWSFGPMRLNNYRLDKHLPNAILFEYLENAQQIDYRFYSEERMRVAVEGMCQICELALVDHRDVHTKHILIVPGPPERVVWIDCDVASSFKDRSVLTALNKEAFDLSISLAEDWGDKLVIHPLLPVLFREFLAAKLSLGRKLCARERVKNPSL